MKEKSVIITIKIAPSELEIIRKTAKLTYNSKKHRKNYGVSAFMKESSLNRAKRVMKVAT